MLHPPTGCNGSNRDSGFLSSLKINKYALPSYQKQSCLTFNESAEDIHLGSDIQLEMSAQIDKSSNQGPVGRHFPFPVSHLTQHRFQKQSLYILEHRGPCLHIHLHLELLQERTTVHRLQQHKLVVFA